MNRITNAEKSLQLRSVDGEIVDALEASGINFACSVPCGLLDGVLQLIDERHRIRHIPVTREEEGVGICAGAYLGGARPALLMQNSGLGNSINALLSLTQLYHMGLLLIMGYRGRLGEELIEAQMPMGIATTKLLDTIGAKYIVIERRRDIGTISTIAEQTRHGIGAVLLTPKAWREV